MGLGMIVGLLGGWLASLGGAEVPTSALTSPTASASMAEESRSVLILANSADPDSVAIAEYYREQRQIPAENVLLFNWPVTEIVDWKTFISQMWNPLHRRLGESGWINGLAEGETDSLGRDRWSIFGHRISYLVLCRGVPLKIASDPALVTDAEVKALGVVLQRHFGFPPEQVIANIDGFKKNEASVDAEFALLAWQGIVPISGIFPNVLFSKQNPTLADRQKVVRVCRLDGPSLGAVKGMIDSAILGEKLGLMGRAYIDQDGRQGGYQAGNDWLREIARTCGILGFDTTIDAVGATLAPSVRFDAPAVYFGWWTWNVDGPFLNPGFRFPAGAVAVHLHSFSAETLRKNGSEPDSRWVGPLVSRGAACTLGNVYEPYLHFSHRLDYFFTSLANGKTFGESAYASLPALSWQAVAVGDPLYRPLRRLVSEQMEDLANPDRADLAPYVILRAANLLLRENKTPAQVWEFAERHYSKAPGLALALALGRYYYSIGKTDRALETMRPFRGIGYLPVDQWMLAKETADFFHRDLKTSQPAFAIYKALLEMPNLPTALESAILPDACLAALGVHETRQSLLWSQRLRELNAPK